MKHVLTYANMECDLLSDEKVDLDVLSSRLLRLNRQTHVVNAHFHVFNADFYMSFTLAVFRKFSDFLQQMN